MSFRLIVPSLNCCYLLICLFVYMYSPRYTLLSLYTVTCVGGFRADPLVLDKQLRALPRRRPPSHCRHSLVACHSLYVRGPDRPLPASVAVLVHLGFRLCW